MGDKELAALLRMAAERLDGLAPAPKRETKADKAARETKDRILKKKLKQQVK